MDLASVVSIPTRFNRMLLPSPGKNSLFISNRPFNSFNTFPCRGSIRCIASNNEVSNDNSDQIETLRRPPVFQPTIWNDDYIQSLHSEFKEETYTKQRQVLREEVRMMLFKVENELDQLELIDVLQRIGLAYHFKNEIKNILDNIYSQNSSSKEKQSLHATSLKFRLLRQHGYNFSADIFYSFKDQLRDFKNWKLVDAKEMLSLYEASFHSFENETILEDARDFTSKFLKEYLKENEGNYISLLIDHALELPLHWRIPRWESQWFIHAYERYKNKNSILQLLAKLDFNIVQNSHQVELKNASRWWKRIGLAENLSFARDRVVENYFWTVGLNFVPGFEYLRSVITKVNSLITIIDDVYDVYGTLEELKLFTEAIERWDPMTIDQLPDCMKICYLALYNFVNEVAFEYLKQNGHNITPHLIKGWTDLCKTYYTEAKWFHSGYIPSFEEYMENAWISISTPIILTHAYFLVPHSFTKEDLVHLEEYSDIIRYSAIILRLANDLGTVNRENEMGDVSKSIECYMNESGACEANAREHMKSILWSTWNKMNKEAHTSSLPQEFKEIAINLARMSLCMYQHGDGHSVQGPPIKNRISSLVFQPIADI